VPGASIGWKRHSSAYPEIPRISNARKVTLSAFHTLGFISAENWESDQVSTFSPS